LARRSSEQLLNIKEILSYILSCKKIYFKLNNISLVAAKPFLIFFKVFKQAFEYAVRKSRLLI